ncbi:MAG: cryptochrome/photolyase family protein [Pikeienuella sp.]
MAKIILVLGDQLSPDLSSLQAAGGDDIVLMVEVMAEATYVKHHKKKIAFILSAMRHFAETLRGAGRQVDYVKLDDPENTGDFSGEIARAVKRHGASGVIVTEAAEWRVLEMMKDWEHALGVPVDILPDTRFICDHAEFSHWAAGRKQLRMEFFYREMRRKTGLLMQGAEPEGAKWNFDADNRKPAKPDLFMPRPPRTAPDDITSEVLMLVQDVFEDHFGDLTPFWFAVDAAGAEAALEAFVEQALPRFGDYQDAMLRDERFLYHSVISQYINAGLLDPLAVCRRVERAYHEGHAPLNAVEGFIRQIIGWREYVRGIYWLKMPEYVDMNALEAHRPLPDFYWTGDTDMACLRAAVTQTREEAYAHHIQRLMVTGTFALLIGAHPREVHEWYLAVYADAFEWVELPNTLGMSQFADGGLLGSKPYAASGAYIDRMSDYCQGCAYKVKQKTGQGACPFNSLYWDFMARNEAKLRANPRLGPTYRTWDRMKDETKTAHRQGAAAFLARL